MDKMVLTGDQARRISLIASMSEAATGWGSVRIKRFIGTENGNGEVVVEHGPLMRDQTTVFPDGEVPGELLA